MGLFGSSGYAIKKYEKGQLIHIQNELCEAMDIILEGKVSIQKIDEEGNILRVAVFSSGEILGANLLFSSSNSYPMFVVSESKTIILQAGRDLILKLSRNNTAFTAGLLTVVSNKTRILTEKIDTISFKTIRQRIIDFLKYEHYIQKSREIKLNDTKKDLAERMGIQRTSLSRELNKMRKEGLIEFTSRTITLKNVRALIGQ